MNNYSVDLKEEFTNDDDYVKYFILLINYK